MKKNTGGFVVALTIAVATYVVMSSQGATVPLAVAVAFATFLVVGAGSARAAKKKGRPSR